MLVRLTADQSVAEALVEKLAPSLLRQGLAKDVWVHGADAVHIHMEGYGTIVVDDGQIIADCSVSDPADVRGIQRAIEKAAWPLNPSSVRMSVVSDR